MARPAEFLTSVAATRPFTLHRHGILMEPKADDPLETEGVLNPACARSADGQLYLFPRLVAKGNYSRIGIARVLFDGGGDPLGVERMGVALEPTEPYEKNPVTGGGCEDSRITYIQELGRYIMTYTAFSPSGPRIALAISSDLFTWERLGLVHFSPMGEIDLNGVDNKDALLFPSFLTDPRTGHPSIGLIHRPTFIGSPTYSFDGSLVGSAGQDPPQGRRDGQPPARQLKHPSVWISYCPVTGGLDGSAVFQSHHQVFQSHHRVLSPKRSWEQVKVGGGAPPSDRTWLAADLSRGCRCQEHFRYSAGAVVLDEQHPEQILYRGREPVLAPKEEDQLGVVPDVVFPTALDERSDIGHPERVDVYYGMADSRHWCGHAYPPTHARSRRSRPAFRAPAPPIYGSKRKARKTMIAAVARARIQKKHLRETLGARFGPQFRAHPGGVVGTVWPTSETDMVALVRAAVDASSPLVPRGSTSPYAAWAGERAWWCRSSRWTASSRWTTSANSSGCSRASCGRTSSTTCGLSTSCPWSIRAAQRYRLWVALWRRAARELAATNLVGSNKLWKRSV